MTFDRARLMLLAAAVLWSFSSVFMRVLGEPTGLGLNLPSLSPLQIAFWRAVFAGLVLLPFLARSRFRFRPATACMMLCFGVMSGLYLSAIGLGSAANAILLQNTAPFWVYLIGRIFLGESSDPRSRRAAWLGLLGACVIVGGNTDWAEVVECPQQLVVFGMALGSGIFYAAVILFLRKLRSDDNGALSVLNLLGSAGLIGTFLAVQAGPEQAPAVFLEATWTQLGWIALFGAVQMALPYWLFSRGLRSVTPQEAGTITLVEPILNPVWAYLIAPDRDAPTVWTLLGGAILLAALLQQYRPWERRKPAAVDADDAVHSGAAG